MLQVGSRTVYRQFEAELRLMIVPLFLLEKSKVRAKLHFVTLIILRHTAKMCSTPVSLGLWAVLK